MKVISLAMIIALMGIIAYGAEFPISTGNNHQIHPDVVFDGTQYTVVYDSVGSIWCAKVRTDGTILEKTMIINDPSYQDTTPSIAYDGTNFFIVWVKQVWGPYGVVIDNSNNIVQGPFQIPFLNGQLNPMIAFNSTYQKYLIVAQSGPILIPSGVAGTIEGIIYNINYTPDGQRFTIDQTGFSAGDLGKIGHPAVDSDVERFLVLYPYSSCPSPNYSTIHSLRYRFVTTAGQVQDGGIIRSVEIVGYESFYYHVILHSYPSDVDYNSPENKYFISYHFAETAYSTYGEYSNVYGRFINTDGSISAEIQIAVQNNVNEISSAVTSEDKGSEVAVCLISNDQAVPQVSFDGFNNLVVWQDYRSGTNWDIYGNLLPKWLTTNDELALAYNGNRHLARKPNTNEFHLVYTDRGKVIYRYSRNEGVDWPTQFIVGDGKWPSITLDPNALPYVTWTDDAGGLWFRYQTSADVWSSIYHLYTPGLDAPYLNSPPSIALVKNRGVIYPHILVTRTGRIVGNGVANLVEDFTFPVTNPGSGTFELLEQVMADPVRRSFPSIVKDDYDTLHAVWQRGVSDTIAYAKRYRLGTWSVWGAVLGDDGLQSAHPFTEAYGNKAYITWQKGPSPEEVWKGYRSLGYHPPLWSKDNMSVTPETKSIYSVSASGFFTVFADEYDSPWDIYYVVTPHDPFYNISQTPGVTSLYPHSVAKFGATYYLYTVWLEGNSSPYEIRFKKNPHIPNLEFAYLSSSSGHNPASPYLVARDGYIETWQIPVDFGYSTITYRFPLLPEFKYKLKAIAYQEGSGEWREWLIIDGQVQHLAKYNPYQPEIIEFMIPPAFYQDSIIEVVFERVEGDFATAGPIEIYRYEYEEGEGGGGPQDVMTIPINTGKLLLNVYPNPVRKEFTIDYALQQEAKVNLSIYDATGRLADVLVNAVQKPGYYNRTLQNSNLAQGIYFVRLSTTDESAVQKVIFLR